MFWLINKNNDFQLHTLIPRPVGMTQIFPSRHEMNRVIQELSKQMSSHLDSQKPGNGKNGDTQLIQRYKKQLSEAQGDLSTEKSLHQITKTSLQALDEDCNRLRAQLQKLRRREKSPVADRLVFKLAHNILVLIA